MNLAMQKCQPLGRSRFAASVLCVALCASGTSARAQTAPAAPAAGEEIVKLPTFSVSTERDYGYRASNSIAGSRTNTPIKDLPVNIQVFTKDLMDDLGMMTQVDLEAYNGSLVNGGMDRNSTNTIQQAYNSFLFRGFQQNWGLRDGLREYDPVDLQGIARVEVVKGPVAALYGLTYPGGVMQNITKAVEMGKNFGRTTLSLDSEGEYRAALDANFTGKINGNNAGIRFNGAYTQSKDQRAHSEGKVQYTQLNFAYQATPTTTVELLAEQGYREKPNGLGYFSRGEAGGISSSNFSDIPLQVVHPEIPWDWNWSDGANMRSLDTTMYRGKITQSVGDLDLQAHWQYSSRRQEDGDGWDASGNTQSGDGWEAGGGWTTYAGQEVIEMGYSYRDWSNQMHTYGFTGVYKLEVAETKHTFAFGANAWAEKFVSRSGTQAGAASPIRLRFPVKAGIPVNTSYAPPPDFHPVTDGNGYTHEDNSNDYYFVNWQMSAFNNRLNTNVSLNRTNVKLLQWANGQATAPSSGVEQSKTSPMLGGVYKITDEISAFGLYSTSLFPDSGKDSRGGQFTPQVGKGMEFGVKFETADGKLSGTVSYFSILREGGSQNDPNKNNVNTDEYDRLTALNTTASLASRNAQWSSRPLGDLIQGGEQEGKGIEVDIAYQPTKNWQLVGSFANVDHEFTKSAVAATIGQTYSQAIKTRYSLLSRYTFTEGEAKGAFVGMGLSAGSKALMGYVNFGGKDVARYEPARMNVDLFAGYKFKLFERDASVQFNVRNLTGEDDYQGWKATGSASTLSTERYAVPLPRIYRLSLSIDL